MRDKLLLLAVFALLLAFGLAPSDVAGQEPTARPVFRLGSPGRKDTPIAVPSPQGGDAATAQEFWAVVRRDLEISGWFSVIDPAAFVEPAGTGVRPGEFDFQDWRIPGAAVLAKTTLETAADKVRSEVWVYDVAGAQKLDARAFSAGSGRTRDVAHRVADAIIRAVTNKDSIFGTRFAAVNDRTGTKEVYVLDVDGYGARPITRNGAINLQPRWSPEGRSLAWTSYRAGKPDLYTVDLTSGTIRRVSARPGLNSGGAWHPKGGLLALTLSFDRDPDIYTIDPSGRQVGRLTDHPGIDTSPAWSPDGSRLAFVSDRSGGAQVYLMNADGSGVRRVTFHGSQNTSPAWSPRGDRIAFVGRDGAFDVLTCAPDGTGLVRITQGQGDNEDPSWSPDGQYLAFSSTRTGSGQIWISTADGGYHVQVTLDKGGWSNPAWSPRLDW
ncbi:MAG: Tol-Pal system beta propeller repeat protein TolB [Deltaproteobacteria bacterium]|nr:Tol-Pal system beta propeller repeat protein TolB [Deltaproteobacteria bacterium]